MGVEWANFWVNFALAIITFLAVIVALFQQKLWEWWNKPQIKFGLKNGEPYIVTTYSGSGQMIKYFRIKIRNNGNSTAKNCYVKLISVTNKNNNVNLIEPDKLKWTSAPTDARYNLPREKVDIFPSGAWEFCDLFRLDSFILTDIFFQSLGGNRKVSIREDYIITIEISGENIKPQKAEIITSLPKNGFWNVGVNWFRNIS